MISRLKLQSSNASIRKILKNLVPPLVIALTRPMRSKFGNNKSVFNSILFDGDDSEFKKAALSARVIGEYGAGASTVWAINCTSAEVVTVESSPDWSKKVELQVSYSPRLHMTAVDLGPLGPWGRPNSYERRSEFQRYIYGIWEQSLLPDVVLIDGRFRVACFLASALSATQFTQSFFDDYVDRAEYHVVEEIMKPVRFCGRQAIFEVDELENRPKAENLLMSFTHVMD